MTKKNIFVYKFFLLLNISDLSFYFVKIETPLKKVTPSFPATPVSKLRSCQAPLFENLVGGSTPSSPLPPAERGGGGGGGVHSLYLVHS